MHLLVQRAELRRQLPLVDARLVRKAGAESLVALLDAGRIVETGRHDELLEIENGLYRKLHALQFRL